MRKLNFLKRIVAASISALLVLLGLFALYSDGQKVEASFSGCPSNTLCLYKDVADYSTSTWSATVANGTPGTEHAFSVGVWNTSASTISNVTVQDTLPTGLTYVAGTLTGFPSGSYSDTDLFAGGMNFGSLAAGASFQMSFKVLIDPTLAAGSYAFTNTANLTATGGYNSSNTATINVDVTDFPADSGLSGYYYNSKYISGSPTFTRVDGVVDSTQLSWPILSGPGGGLGDDNFSVKWEGQVKSDCTGPITIKTNSDDGIRVFLNNALIIDKWFDRGQPIPLDQAVVNLTAGVWNNLRVDYYEHGGGSIAQLYWNSSCQTATTDEIIPQQNLRQTYTGSMNYGLTGDYFNNENVNGSPVVTRIDLGVNFNFDLGSPAAGVNTDNFSARWTGKVTTDFSETYQFCVTSDDGTRLWIDDVNIIEQWTAHGMTEYCGTIPLTAGAHNIRLDYFDQYVDSAVNLKWSSASQTGGLKEFVSLSNLSPAGYTGADFGLTGEYFNNTTFTGIPVLTRIDGPINFDFGTGSPDGSVNSNLFSIRWTGTFKALEAGNHNFIIYSDDGVKLIIDGVTRIDQLVSQSLTRNESGNIALSAGDHTIEIQYFDEAESAGIFFQYTTPSNATERTVPMSVLLN